MIPYTSTLVAFRGADSYHLHSYEVAAQTAAVLTMSSTAALSEVEDPSSVKYDFDLIGELPVLHLFGRGSATCVVLPSKGGCCSRALFLYG